MSTSTLQAPMRPMMMKPPMPRMVTRSSVVAKLSMVMARFSSSASWTPLPLKSSSVALSDRRTMLWTKRLE